ncbi:hypothetical protein EAF00_008272 [Botryotinia globosa]|nr:hypothetical protein EAF00_008272 [Botryotinia globosa]
MHHQHQHEKLDSKMLQGLRFPTPESHDTIDLVKLVSDNVDRHVYDSRTALGIKEITLECLTKRSDYSTRSYFSEKAYDPSDHPENLSLSYLFAIFNNLFFLGFLTYRTTVSRSAKATDLTYRTLRRPASPTINTLIEIPVHSSGRIDCDRPANIVVPFVNPFQSQIAGLLGAMIDLYIRYNSCVNLSCLGNIVIRGKMGRGQAWQIIAYNLEVSDTMRAMKEAIGMEVNLRTMDELEWELSHWKLTELEQLKQWMYRHSSDTWTRALKYQLRCLRVAQDRISNQAVARDDGRHAGNESDRPRFGRMMSLFGRKI